MSHEIMQYDNPAYLKKPAWHGLGVVISEGDVQKMDDQHILSTSGLDFDVDKLPVYRRYDGPNGRPRYFEVPGFFMTVRRDLEPTNPCAYLGQVGDNYTTIQNSSLRDFAVQLSDTGELIFETAGTLRNGKLAWMLARCPNSIQIMDDEQMDYMLLSTSHDGSEAFVTSLTRVRVVCWNTLSAALREAEYWYKVRHTENSPWKIEEAKAALSVAKKFSREFTNTMYSFAKQEVNKRFVDAFLKAIIPGDNTKTNKAGKTVKTPQADRRDELAGLIYGGQIGGDREVCWSNGNPTLYGVYNALTQWGETSRQVKCRVQANGEKRDENEARMDSVLFGSFANLRQTGFDLCAAWAGLEGYENLRQQIADATVGN